MTTPLLFLAGAVLLGLPGCWLLLRPARAALAGAVVLLALATALGYAGIRLWQALPPPAPAFRLTAPAGHFQTVTPAALPAALAASRGRPVLLEFYADWCPSCIVWKRDVFSRADVQAALAPVVLLQVDATELTPEVQALLDQYGLPGLPALLAFGRNGQEQATLRLLGEMPAPAFIRWVEFRLLPAT